MRPVIDEQDDGVCIYVTEMPPILLNVEIDYSQILKDYEDD